MFRRSVALAITATLMLIGSTALAAPSSDAFTQAVAQGPLAAAVAAFLGGLLVSLTPCVYPMVAVTVSVFGAKQAQSRLQGILLSASFVAGIMVMFVALGLVATATANVFGAALQSPWVVLGIASLFVLMALSMFGVFEFALPSGLVNRLVQVGGIGFRGAFLLGLVSGIVAAPCTGPVLTGILAWIATTRDYVLGTLAMSTFALGLGMPFFAVGAFAIQLPKSGRWMMTVKTALGVLLLIVALYLAGSKLAFLLLLVPRGALGWYLGIGAFLGAIPVALFVRRANKTQLSRVAALLAIALFTFAGFAGVTKLTRAEVSLSWEHQNYRDLRARASAEQRPLLVDFTANWCTACKELDRETFSHPEVRVEAGRFLAVKVDASVDDDPEVVSAMKELAVKGLPTVVLFDSHGREVHRFNDFVKAEVFLSALRDVQ